MNKLFGRLSILILFLVTVLHPLTSFSSPVDVYISLPPLKWLSDQIGLNNIKSHVLVGKGQDPHTFEPTPKQIISLSQARLFFTTGMSFEKKIADKINAIPNHPTHVDLSRHVQKLPSLIDDHTHTKDSRSHLSADETAHIPEKFDPHVWLSPVNLKIMAFDLAEALIQTDPSHKADYQNNLQNLISRLDELHLRLKKKFEPYRGATVFVFHPAFSYFTATYQLKQKAVEIEGKSPTPRELAALIARARASNIKVIFVQPQFDPKSALTIASAIHGKVIPLNPLAEDLYANLTLISDAIIEAQNN